MASVGILNLKNFDFFLLNSHPGNGNLHLRTKSDRHRIIRDWDMEIKLFSKWRPSAIFNLRKLPSWSPDQYLHVILHLLSEFRDYRPLRRRDVAINDIQYGVRPPSWIWKMSIFVKFTCSKWKSASVYQIWNRIIHGWNREIKLFLNGPNFALIGQYGAEI